MYQFFTSFKGQMTFNTYFIRDVFFKCTQNDLTDKGLIGEPGKRNLKSHKISFTNQTL